MYEYVFIETVSDRAWPVQRQIAEHVQAAVRPAATQAGGQILGLFTPQLGWSTRQAALLVDWGEAANPAAAAALFPADTFRLETHRLTPTLRPRAADRLAPGGIYVHRWFEVEAGAIDEFLALSGQGWTDFEARFDARIFGLFRADLTPADESRGIVRLLLITRYGDHGVWEASRDPTTEGMGHFLRRQQLTRRSIAASTLLANLG